MKYALQKLPNGESRMVDANGCPLGSSDADRPILHILPKLLVPAGMLGAPSEPFEGLACEEIALTVTTSLPIDVLPEGGIQVRQPYPNPRYFVGGSQLIRNGWIVPLPLDATEFDIEFHWHIESASVWRVFSQGRLGGAPCAPSQTPSGKRDDLLDGRFLLAEAGWSRHARLPGDRAGRQGGRAD